jgi:hypothetical protein
MKLLPKPIQNLVPVFWGQRIGQPKISLTQHFERNDFRIRVYGIMGFAFLCPLKRDIFNRLFGEMSGQ